MSSSLLPSMATLKLTSKEQNDGILFDARTAREKEKKIAHSICVCVCVLLSLKANIVSHLHREMDETNLYRNESASNANRRTNVKTLRAIVQCAAVIFHLIFFLLFFSFRPFRAVIRSSSAAPARQWRALRTNPCQCDMSVSWLPFNVVALTFVSLVRFCVALPTTCALTWTQRTETNDTRRWRRRRWCRPTRRHFSLCFFYFDWFLVWRWLMAIH